MVGVSAGISVSVILIRFVLTGVILNNNIVCGSAVGVVLLVLILMIVLVLLLLVLHC